MTTSAELEDKILEYVKAQKLQPGDKLPSERQLARQWEVSHSTVNRAILRLVTSGILRRDKYTLYYSGNTKIAETKRQIHIFARNESSCQTAVRLLEAQSLSPQLTIVSKVEDLNRSLLKIDNEGGSSGILHLYADRLELLAQLSRKDIPVVTIHRFKDLDYVSKAFRSINEKLVRLLYHLGHRNLCYINKQSLLHYHSLRTKELRSGYRRTCLELGLTTSAKRVDYSTNLDEVSVAKVLKETPNSTTAIICECSRLGLSIVSVLRKQGIKIPDECSVCVCEDDTFNLSASPLLTSCDVDQDMIVEQATLLLIQKIKRKDHAIPKQKLYQFLMQPTLIERGSTGIAPNIRKKRPTFENNFEDKELPPVLDTWPRELSKRLEWVDKLHNQRFALHSKKVNYRCLDLTPFLNHSTRRQNSWLGQEPILHLRQQPKTIHGVPITLVNEKRNEGKSALVLRSLHAHCSGRHPLPLQVSIPVNQKVIAVNILHGAGWALDTPGTQIAEYSFMYSKGSDSVPVCTLGRPKQGAKIPDTAIIQDWHPTYHQKATKHALPFVISAKDPLEYSRFLYNYEWRNPHPDRKLKTIRIKALSENSPTTLGILAITLKIAG